jgi:hypothetical protein
VESHLRTGPARWFTQAARRCNPRGSLRPSRTEGNLCSERPVCPSSGSRGRRGLSAFQRPSLGALGRGGTCAPHWAFGPGDGRQASGVRQPSSCAHVALGVDWPSSLGAVPLGSSERNTGRGDLGAGKPPHRPQILSRAMWAAWFRIHCTRARTLGGSTESAPGLSDRRVLVVSRSGSPLASSEVRAVSPRGLAEPS